MANATSPRSEDEPSYELTSAVTGATLSCSDNKTYDVGESLTFMSEMIKDFMDFAANIDEKVPQLPLPYISSHVLRMVMVYCKKHYENSKSKSTLELEECMKLDEKLNEWDSNFIKVDPKDLICLHWAAKYLRIECLMKLTSRTEAVLIKAGSKRKVRDMDSSSSSSIKSKEQKSNLAESRTKEQDTDPADNADPTDTTDSKTKDQHTNPAGSPSEVKKETD